MNPVIKSAFAGAALAVIAAGAAQAQRPHLIMPPGHAPAVPANAACSLVLEHSYGPQQLIARAAPGVSGSWTLYARGPGLRVDQSGPLSAAPRTQLLSRITLNGRDRPVVNRAATGLYGPVRGPAPQSVSGLLEVRDDYGRVICRAEPELRQAR